MLRRDFCAGKGECAKHMKIPIATGEAAGETCRRERVKHAQFYIACFHMLGLNILSIVYTFRFASRVANTIAACDARSPIAPPPSQDQAR